MGLFTFFKRPKRDASLSTHKELLGPTYLEGWTESSEGPEKRLPHEWRGKLKTPAGQTRFNIKYYGMLHEDYPNLIVGTDFAPPLVYALDPSTGQEILLFDGCKHGYNAMFCDTFSVEQMNNRPADKFYKDQEGKFTFEIVFSTYNQAYYDDEFKAEVDDVGRIELIDGTKLEWEKARRNAFDTLRVFATNEDGKVSEILSEELA